MSLIFAGSTELMSSRQTSRFIGPFLRWLNPEVSDETIGAIQFAIRKCGHLAEYALLALLLWRARRQHPLLHRTWRHGEALFAVLGAALYAISDELHQAMEATRQGSFIDVLIDTAGAVVAMVLLWRIGRWRRWWT